MLARGRGRAASVQATQNTTVETSSAAAAPVAPHAAPNTSASGTSTSVSTPCVTMRRFGRPIETGNDFVQPEHELEQRRDEHEPGRVGGRDEVGAEHDPEQVRHEHEQRHHDDRHQRGRAGAVAAHAGEDAVVLAALPVAASAR